MSKQVREELPEGVKRGISKEVPVFILIFFGFFILVGSEMGAANMFSTMMNTAHDLLINTVFYIMAIAVLAGAVSALFSEFGVIFLLNKLLSPLIGPLYGLANAHDIAVFTAMCMCWSGYLSTHVAMMDSLKCSELTGKAIISHTIGGLCAGVAANWGYYLITLFL